MLQITNTRIYGMSDSLVAAGFPMQAMPMGEEEFDNAVLDLQTALDNEPMSEAMSTHVSRGMRLGGVATGTGHDNFLKGIIVQANLKYPNYWTPQFQRYSFHDIISSSSKMHRITATDISKSVNKYVDYSVIKNLNKWIEIYNGFPTNVDSVRVITIAVPNIVKARVYTEIVYGDDKFNTSLEGNATKIETYSKYEIYMKIISNTPLGFEQTMRITTNYLQLKTIYLQRKNHKLSEDWGAFCCWCETALSGFVELCLGGKRKYTNDNGIVLDKYKELYAENDYR